MKVADAGVIAHAMYVLFQLFLYHLLVMDLEAILAVYQANVAVLEADGGSGGTGGCRPCGPKGISGSSKKVTFGGDG